jgi:glycosyltransferase involved in cell wall biosynthesis
MLMGPLDAWRALHRIKPNMIHVHDPELIPLAILWRAIYKMPAIFDAHEDLPKQVLGKAYIPLWLRSKVAWLARQLEKFADRALDGIVAATPAICRNFTRAPVALVQNFPWLSDFAEAQPADSGRRPSVCYVGSITRERGGLEMIEAVQASRSRSLLIMAGPMSSDMAAAVSRGAPGNIKYLGVVNAEHVSEVVDQSLAGLVIFHPLPNHVECQPTKIFEYMAAGRPFIASDFPAWRALLGHFECGYFVDPLNVDELREAIDALALKPLEARQMGARGRSALIEKFTFEIESAGLIEFTRDLLASSEGSASGLDRMQP